MDGYGLEPLEQRPSAMQSDSGHYINSVSDLYGTDEIEFLLDDIRDLEPASCNPEDIQVLYYTDVFCFMHAICFILFLFCFCRYRNSSICDTFICYQLSLVVIFSFVIILQLLCFNKDLFHNYFFYLPHLHDQLINYEYFYLDFENSYSFKNYSQLTS